jgi:sRNA-binding regulator protein Hfq
MFVSDFIEYVDKGDDVIVELYSGKQRRGIFIDYDDFAIILMTEDSGLVFKRIIPADEIEFPTLVYKSEVIKSKINENKKED